MSPADGAFTIWTRKFLGVSELSDPLKVIELEVLSVARVMLPKVLGFLIGAGMAVREE